VRISARKTYDLEVWLPSSGKYREILQLLKLWRFSKWYWALKRQGKGTQFVHTLNGSMVGRTMAAILENYQQPDRTVRVPLQPHLKCEVLTD